MYTTGDYKTPQLHIIGKLAYAKGFECHDLYCKFWFKTGKQWTCLAGHENAETFLAIVDNTKIAALEFPIDINYAAKSVRGWPKILIEIWTVDDLQKSTLGGYGVASIPVQPGFHQIDVHCWRPLTSDADKTLGTFPELEYKDILIATQSKYGLTSQTTGSVRMELEILTKDFHLHGVSTFPREQD